MTDTGIIIAPVPDRPRPRPGLPLRSSRDEVLARRVAGGDEGAFAEIHRRYHPTLYRYCRSIVRHEQDAQDALQATLISAYGALRDGRRDAPLRPWLFRIAHNESISLLRRRRPEAELSEALPGLVGVEETAHVRERMSRLVADLATLPDRQRSALVMRELNGLSHEDIAAALQTTPAAAKQTIFEARRALADLEAGRAMSCEEICRLISDGDGRSMRGRRVRAHLHACEDCAAFAQAIRHRSADLRALTPLLPPAAGAMLLSRVLGAAGKGSSAAAAATAGQTVAASSVTKAVVAGAVLAGGVAGYAHVAGPHHRAHRPAVTAHAGREIRLAAPRALPGPNARITVPAALADARSAALGRHGARATPVAASGQRQLRHAGRAGAVSVASGTASAGSGNRGVTRHGASATPAATGQGALATTRGNSSGHAVRRGRGGTGAPPGQVRRTTGASAGAGRPRSSSASTTSSTKTATPTPAAKGGSAAAHRPVTGALRSGRPLAPAATTAPSSTAPVAPAILPKGHEKNLTSSS